MFGLMDWAVFVGVLGISVAVGVFYALKERFATKETTAQDYLTGGRKLPLIPVALSLLVSFQSAILVLGTPADVFYYGTVYWWATVGISLSAVFTCYIFVPVFYHLKLISVYEYLEVRYSSRTLRRIGSCLYIAVTVIYLSLAMYAPAVALAAVIDVMSVQWFIVLAGVLCTFYVGIGGMKAVIWTDALQAGVMLLGLIVVAWKGTTAVGGIAKVWSIGEERGRIIYFDWNISPFTRMSSFGIIIGQTVSWLGWYGINQSAVQRYCGMATVRHGQIALLANIPALFFCISLVTYCGLVAYAYFEMCNPLSAGAIEASDQLMPYFVSHVIGDTQGVLGLFLACLFSGTMSTVSSGLNSISAVIYQDFLQETIADWPAHHVSLLTKGLCFFFGALCTGLAFLGPYLGTVLDAALKLMGVVNGPLTGMFLVGVLFPWANRRGVMAGALASALICLVVAGGSLFVPFADRQLETTTKQCERFDIVPSMSSANTTAALPFRDEVTGFSTIFTLSSTLYDLLGVVLVFIFAIPISYITGFANISLIDSRLVHPLYVRFGVGSHVRENKIASVDSSDGACEERRKMEMTPRCLVVENGGEKESRTEKENTMTHF